MKFRLVEDLEQSQDIIQALKGSDFEVHEGPDKERPSSNLQVSLTLTPDPDDVEFEASEYDDPGFNIFVRESSYIDTFIDRLCDQFDDCESITKLPFSYNGKNYVVNLENEDIVVDTSDIRITRYYGVDGDITITWYAYLD